MNDHIREDYAAADRKVQQGTCPICSGTLRGNYCERHALVKSGVGTEIDGVVYDEKLLELAAGCKV